MSISNLFLYENSFLKFRMLQTKREVWVHEVNTSREILGEFHHLYENLRKYPQKFFEYTRMSINSFDLLLSKVEDKLEKQTTGWRRPIGPTERLIVCLRYLATGASFRSLAFTFRMGKSTVVKIIEETCKIIWDDLQTTYMPVPTQEQLKTVIDQFYTRWNFPNCFGAIDGKHCKIKCPANTGSTYFNYKKHFSIVLQAVADADCKFIVIEVGGAGRQSDGGTFNSSTLYNLLESNQFNVPDDNYLPNSMTKVPNVLVGDEAYPLKTYLMRPYPRNNLTPEHAAFNCRLSRARRCVECAFGIMSAKWRILTKDIETNTDTACSIIKAACILHNFVRELDGINDSDYTYVHTSACQIQPNADGRRSNNPTVLAKDVRKCFTNYFKDTPINING